MPAFALVLATLISQAFSFSAIRFFEGYWKGPLVWLGVYRIMVRHRARKRAKLADDSPPSPHARSCFRRMWSGGCRGSSKHNPVTLPRT
ncbi:hypothetical protein AB0L41_28495 [Amycolatopsis mediterranei]|uniref:hypothetical protein n=1 Tax=Amycolatopsis mediterranei TaxID=33910 RepID=UPI0034191BD1